MNKPKVILSFCFVFVWGGALVYYYSKTQTQEDFTPANDREIMDFSESFKKGDENRMARNLNSVENKKKSKNENLNFSLLKEIQKGESVEVNRRSLVLLKNLRAIEVNRLDEERRDMTLIKENFAVVPLSKISEKELPFSQMLFLDKNSQSFIIATGRYVIKLKEEKELQSIKERLGLELYYASKGTQTYFLQSSDFDSDLIETYDALKHWPDVERVELELIDQAPRKR